jgi:hypothetical protein
MLEANWDLSEEDMREEHGDVMSWHRWFLRTFGVEDHPRRNRWAVILSGVEDPIGGIIQDGWHRLNEYVRQGARVIPVVYYPW